MNAPVKTIKDKGLQIAIWETNNGGYSFSISKRYKCKKTDQWKDSKYFYKEDLEKLQAMIEAAIGYASDRAAHTEAAMESGSLSPSYKAPETAPFTDDDLPF